MKDDRVRNTTHIITNNYLEVNVLILIISGNLEASHTFRKSFILLALVYRYF